MYLGSAQPITDQIYGRAEQFAFLFAASGALMALTLVINDRLIVRFGTPRLVLLAGAVLLAVSALGIPMVVAYDGVPPLSVFFVWVAVANAISIVLTPMCSALVANR